ncbi:MAG: HgcAB-associated protein HgcC [Promethearchaeota archaeon]
MTEKKNENSCYSPNPLDTGYCRVEAIVSIDSKGQLLLPKNLRNKLTINASDKLVAVSLGDSENICGVFLLKADRFNALVKNFLRPFMKDLS